MKRFRFPLEGLERVRNQEVREEEIRLAERLRAERTIAAETERVASILERSNAERPDGDCRALSLWEERRAWLRRERARLDARAAEAAASTREQQLRLEAAERRRQVVERIRDRRRMEYLSETLREEQRETDEIAGRGHARKVA